MNVIFGDEKPKPVELAVPVVRANSGKLKWSLLSWIALRGLVAILMFGAKKYAANAWKQNPMPWTETAESGMRHLTKFLEGEDLDFDASCAGCIAKTCMNHSGLPHVDHLMCNAMFLSHYYHTKSGKDDRG